jgi:hypothetical protein
MKKFTFLIAMMLVSSIVFGQFEFTGKQIQSAKINTNKNGVNRGVPDTLWQYLTRATNFYLYNAGTYGYVAPSNSFSTETGMHYTFSGSAKVTQLLLWFGAKYQIGATPNVHTAEVYKAGAADSLPTGTVLGTGTFTTADVDTTGNFTSVTFTPAPTVTSDFVVAITGMSATNVDTLVLVCNSNAAGDGKLEHRLKVHLVAGYGGVWKSLSALFTGGFNGDAMMIPVIEATSGIPAVSNDLTLTGIYPNPASSNAAIKFSLSKDTKVNIKIFDVTGRIYSNVDDVMMSGNHISYVDLSNMSNGTYYYTVSTSDGQLTSKFQVVK